MYVLEDLWTGNVAFRDEAVQDGSLYQEISRKSISYLEMFRKELSPEGKKALDAYYNAQMQLGDISEREAFIRGVRLGAQFILDVIGEYNPQLPTMQDGDTTE